MQKNRIEIAGNLSANQTGDFCLQEPNPQMPIVFRKMPIAKLHSPTSKPPLAKRQIQIVRQYQVLISSPLLNNNIKSTHYLE